MARALVFNLEGEVSQLPLTRVDRAKLYGERKRLVVDEQGDPCRSAYLSSDGSTLVPAGGLAMCYLDEHGAPVERSELLSVDHSGEVLDKLPSTLGQEVELSGPVDPSRVLDHITRSVYLLNPSEIGPKLTAGLDRGEIYETEFRYTATPNTNVFFLLRNDAGTFGLICQAVDFTFLHSVTNDELDTSDDEEELDDEDLDFSF